jgi:hypothetical protein
VLVEVAENMKITLPGGKGKQGLIVIKTGFFRGKIKKRCGGNWRGCV